MQHDGLLMRAGSWQVHGEASLLKTASDVIAQVAGLNMQGHKMQQRFTEAHHEGKTNSVDSSSTATGRHGPNAHHLLDSATAQLLPPLRQISLDIIAASEFNRAKGLAPERQSIFQDVFEQLSGRDDLPPLQPGQLYTLPSMQFLENMLSDFDSKTSSSTAPGIGLPLDLPADAFDLPDLYAHQQHPHQQQQQAQERQQASGGAGSATAAAAALRPTPFDQQDQQLLHQQQVAAAQHQQQQHGMRPGYGFAAGGQQQQAQQQLQQQQTAAYSSFVPIAPAAMQAHLAPGMHSSQSMTLQVSSRAHSAYAPLQMAHVVVAPSRPQDAPHAAQQQQAQPPAVRQPAVPQPQQPRATPRRASQAYADFDYEEAEVSLQTSKSGRVRKVASFTGVKRRLDVAGHAAAGTTVSESRDSRGSVGGVDVCSGEVGSKGARKPAAVKGRKGRRTVCLNCGCHQTPQWRCGPLGPRTLCNACGVRFKKDLPLNCWPIRDGMVLPPGAVLPPGFVIPSGITIHIQPPEHE